MENTGVPSKYLYAPYELRYDTPILDKNTVGEGGTDRAAPMDESQRRRALNLQEQVWTRTWRRAGPGERLRLKYREFL